MVVTIWCPYRYVPGTIEYPLAMAGRLFESEGLLPEGVAVDFARSFWGLEGKAGDEAGSAVHELYMAAPTKREYDRIMFGRDARENPVAFSRADRQMCAERIAVVGNAGRVLQRAAREASRNGDRLLDLVVAAEYLWRLYAFGLSDRRAALDWRGLQRSMRAAWARGRYCEGEHYAGKSKAKPFDWGDYDAVMRHVNRLA